MRFNTKKFDYAHHVTTKRIVHPFHYSVKGNNMLIAQHHPYLGVEFSDDLRWNSHIPRVFAKVNRVILNWIPWRGISRLVMFYKSLHGQTALPLPDRLVRANNNISGHGDIFIQVPNRTQVHANLEWTIRNNWVCS